MRIYTRQEFMKLPAGTIYAKGEPWCFNEMGVKAQSTENDFLQMDLVNIEARNSGELYDRYEEMLRKGASYPMDDDCYGRDGCFDDKEIFLVYERDDLVKLQRIISEALEVASNKS